LARRAAMKPSTLTVLALVAGLAVALATRF
jgi:hypothetical protein